jgi:hypothetical protein
MIGTTATRNSLRILLLLVALAGAAILPQVAVGHGDSGARAQQPSFDSSAVRLSGAGGYGTNRAHESIRVTVCLEKRYGGSFFTVKCNTAYDSDRRVRARVAVPGCVRGVWRTTATGEALGRGGNWRHAAGAVSPRFRCTRAQASLSANPA